MRVMAMREMARRAVRKCILALTFDVLRSCVVWFGCTLLDCVQEEEVVVCCVLWWV
jgi:hypothetical protein